MKITFIRHTSVAVPPGICYGQSDIEVAETFETEALQVLGKIKDKSFDAVYSSPLRRCTKLADYCGFTNPVTDERLMELNFGDWEMQAWDNIVDPQLQIWFNNWVDEQPTNGESFAEQVMRVGEFLDELRNRSCQQVLVFTHAGIIRATAISLGLIEINQAFSDYKVDYGGIFNFAI
ncbi:MAG TPA: alpha-ribazole phosphatase [Paludibacter sp.]|nr:alpha-ribazole phosphatase [Paludibacter sp.]